MRSTVTIDCFRLVIIRFRCYAPFNTFLIYCSINSVSPNGLSRQQQLSHIKYNFIKFAIRTIYPLSKMLIFNVLRNIFSFNY